MSDKLRRGQAMRLHRARRAIRCLRTDEASKIKQGLRNIVKTSTRRQKKFIRSKYFK
jgi:hypothetical protein